MNARRVVLVVTCLIVAGLGVWFVLARWDQANRVATVASALGAIAAVGVAVWAALDRSGTRTGRGVNVSRTGRVFAGPDGTANSGVQVRGTAMPTDVQVRRTGDADTVGGHANTGLDWDGS